MCLEIPATYFKWLLWKIITRQEKREVLQSGRRPASGREQILSAPFPISSAIPIFSSFPLLTCSFILHTHLMFYANKGPIIYNHHGGGGSHFVRG